MRYARILLCIPVFFFLLSLRLWGMELVPLDSPSSSRQEQLPSVNSTLTMIAGILENNLGTGKHTISIDGYKKNLCSLSRLGCEAFSGKTNKVFRENLKSLLYIPLTDPYYGFCLNQRDYEILLILKDSIKQDTPIYLGLMQQTFNVDDLSILNLLIESILSQEFLKKKFNSSENRVEKNNIPQLFIRRSIDEIHNILLRQYGKDKHGLLNLSKLKGSNLPNMTQERECSIQMTLAKANMMPFFDLPDLDNIRDLKTAILDPDGQFNDFDTPTQSKLNDLFNDVIMNFEVSLKRPLSIQDKLEAVISVSDISWLDSCINFEGIYNNIQASFSEIQADLTRMFSGKDYLHHLPFYNENKMWRKRHKEILSKMNTDQNDPVYLIDLFTELSQMKMALNCLSNA